MREQVTRERLGALMEELARRAPGRGPYRVYFVGGGTAVYLGWRRSSIDIGLCADSEAIFRDIQQVKQLLNINIEFARPEDFVPPLEGSSNRHVYIDTIRPVTFYHYDPCAQCFSKIVRGFQRDIDDAREFIRSGMVDPERLRSLVASIPEREFARYPSLTRTGVESAVSTFLSTMK